MKYIFAYLLLLALAVWAAALSVPGNNLKIVACNVGQGDAILLINGANDILIDGGPNNDVLECLGKHLPFWDRDIELVILTHPQMDHYYGLIEVFRRYNVKNFLGSSLESSSDDYQVLKQEIDNEASKQLFPAEAKEIRLGLIHLDVLNPLDSGMSSGLGTYTSKQDPNDFSVVVHAEFRNFTGLFTGDIGPKTIRAIAEDALFTDIDYLKVPHHGSKNGTTQELLDKTTPEIAVISVGVKNRFGHPNKEVLEMLENMKIKIFRTDEIGDVVIQTNGDTMLY